MGMIPLSRFLELKTYSKIRIEAVYSLHQRPNFLSKERSYIIEELNDTYGLRSPSVGTGFRSKPLEHSSIHFRRMTHKSRMTSGELFWLTIR